MGLSMWQLLLVAVLLLLLFGRGRIPALMSDLAAGIKNFKSGLDDDPPERNIGAEAGPAVKKIQNEENVS